MNKNRPGMMKRILAFMMTLMLLLTGFSFSFAEGQMLPDDWMNLMIGVTWVNGDSEQMFAATPITEIPGSYWIMIPQEALSSSLKLDILYPGHETCVFMPESGSYLDYVIDAHDSVSENASVIISVMDALNPATAFSVLLYVSSTAMMPVIPAEVPATEEPMPEPVPEPVEEPMPEPVPEPVEEPMPEPVPEPAEEPMPEPVPEPVEEPMPEPVPEPVEEPMPEPVPEPVEEPMPEPVPEPVEEPMPEPVPEPTEEPLPEPVPEPVEEPLPEPVPESVEEPMPEPIPGPAEEPMPESVPETIVEPIPEPTEEPTPEPVTEDEIPMGEMINRYSTTNKSVRFRSEKNTKDKKNIIKELKSGEVVFVLREEPDYDGNSWYAVIYRDMFGYVMKEYVNTPYQFTNDEIEASLNTVPPVKTEEELNDLENPIIPEPATAEAEPEIENLPPYESLPETEETGEQGSNPESADIDMDQGDVIVPPEPEDTPVPFGEMINRYSKTTSSVKFRTGAGKNNKVLRELKKGDIVYLLRETSDSEGNSWYAAYSNGDFGYVMSEFVIAPTQAESDAIALAIGTPYQPMTAEELDARENPPTEIPAPTEEETPKAEEPTPTMEVTATPTQEPMPTEVPTATPTTEPTLTEAPTATPTTEPTPTEAPTATPTTEPTPTEAPTATPTTEPTPTEAPTATPTTEPTPTEAPTATPTMEPTPTEVPTEVPTEIPTAIPVVTEAPVITAEPTALPPQVSGYFVTIGDGAYVRNWPSSYSVIADELLPNTVVFVDGQYYDASEAWHQIRYDNKVGYVRADMLRMMSQQEVVDYLNIINSTPSPTETVTVSPYNTDSLSSYGYVTRKSVNFRERPTTSSKAMKQLNTYALCLVLGTTEVDGKMWYRVSYDGQTGYIDSNYFTQMTLGEWETFYSSGLYQQGIRNNQKAETTTEGNQDGVVSAEDQKVNVWTNPDSGVSYKPFDAFATPEPISTTAPTDYLDSLAKDIENGEMDLETAEIKLKVYYQSAENKDEKVTAGLDYIREKLGITETESPSPEPSESPVPESMETVTPELPTDETQNGTNIVLWLIIGSLILAAIGGGVWYFNVDKKRKAAQAAAKRKAAQAKQRQQSVATGSGRSVTADPQKGSVSDGKQIPRTGHYTGESGKTSITTSSNPETGVRTEKPYSRMVENPYSRYSSKTGTDNNYTASFRPDEESADHPVTTTRRRTRSSKYENNSKENREEN